MFLKEISEQPCRDYPLQVFKVRLCCALIPFSLICTFVATVQPSDMASKFEQVHNECRGRVCVCCYRKGDRTISSKEVECIDSYFTEGYTVENPDFPNALCTDCHIELNKKINDKGYHLVHKVDDYDPG